MAATPENRPASMTTRGRTAVIAGVMLLIVLAYVFRLGTNARGRLFVLYYSYFADVTLPFYMYFLFCLVDTRVRFLLDWRLKAVLVFGVASFVEVLQALGVPLLGRTFDPLDFAMYAGGTLLAVLADRLFLERLRPRLPAQEQQ
jgi:hypothetical protein